MSKKPVNPEWLKWLDRKIPEFLIQFRPSVEKIIEFGCWHSDEPYALLWTLDASEVVVVDKEQSHLERPQGMMRLYDAKYPGSLDGRSVEFITAHMGLYISDLRDDYFDLAYCENVLYNFLHEEANYEELSFAIEEMVRVTRPGGIIVAIEPKLGAKFEKAPDPLGFDGTVSVRVSDPIDITPLLVESKLSRVELDDMEFWFYCFRKSE